MNETNDINEYVLSPLADPVVGAIFANVEVAGLAAESLIRATLESDNNSLNGKIVRVTPQKSYLDPLHRGCRVDIDTETDNGEQTIFEVQMTPDLNIMKRDLFSASHIFVGSSNKGETSYQMSAKMPQVIYINILGYNIRESNREIVQPFKILYTKPPQETAISNFSGYNVQLPRILEAEPDFSSGIYCWGYTLYTAHKEGKTVEEVIAMMPALQEYAKKDTGYQQFCEQYQLVSANPETRKEYAMWVNNRMREEGQIEWALQEKTKNIVLNMLQINRPLEEIAKVTDLTLEEVSAIRDKYKTL
jgi:hypothetical protein